MRNEPDVPFTDRASAGAELASHLGHYAGRGDVIVLGLPRGGVPVAAVVAEALGAPLDVFVVRKIGAPRHRELAIGAIASGGVRILNTDLMSELRLQERDVASVIDEEERELIRREHVYRQARSPRTIDGQVVIIVDDGLATGATMLAAVRALRGLRPQRIVVAVPVGSGEACRKLERAADEVVCARTPAAFVAVGQWYLDFSETPDSEVTRLLRQERAQ